MIRTSSIALSLAAALLFSVGPVHANGGGGGGGDMGGSMEPMGPSPAEIEEAYNDGVKFIAAGEFKKAASKFRMVTQNLPDNADAWNYLGYSSRKAGDVKRSESAYKRALKIAPNHPRANQYYGEFLVEQSRIPEAEERLTVLNACCADAQTTKDLAALIADAKAGKPVTFANKPTGY